MVISTEPLPETDPGEAMLNELNRRMARITDARNAAPDPEMGGLSPNQVHRLIHSPWGTPGAPLTFNTAIPLADLQASDFFRQTRALLKAIGDSGEIRATSGGNLPRAFVSAVLPVMCDAETLAVVYRFSKIVNEQDVRVLHIGRVVAQAAGLLRFQKGKFSLPRSKAALLEDGRAGELCSVLLETYFRKFNIAYANPFSVETRGLQACVGYTLYRLGVVALDWLAVDSLPEQCLLPSVRAEIEARIRGHVYWTIQRVATGQLLWPLLDWGLLEGQYKAESKRKTDPQAVRVTPLFKSFLRFDLGG